MNGNYLIPANTKRGKLIFGLFRQIDLIIFASGVGVSLLLLALIPVDTTSGVVIVLLPGLVCSGLVAPVPNYHNVMNVLVETYEFFTNRQKYIWKGWCFKDGDKTSIK